MLLDSGISVRIVSCIYYLRLINLAWRLTMVASVTAGMNSMITLLSVSIHLCLFYLFGLSLGSYEATTIHRFLGNILETKRSCSIIKLHNCLLYMLKLTNIWLGSIRTARVLSFLRILLHFLIIFLSRCFILKLYLRVKVLFWLILSIFYVYSLTIRTSWLRMTINELSRHNYISDYFISAVSIALKNIWNSFWRNAFFFLSSRSARDDVLFRLVGVKFLLFRPLILCIHKLGSLIVRLICFGLMNPSCSVMNNSLCLWFIIFIS